MEIDKLIEQLRLQENLHNQSNETTSADLCAEAADALTTMQAREGVLIGVLQECRGWVWGEDRRKRIDEALATSGLVG